MHHALTVARGASALVLIAMVAACDTFEPAPPGGLADPADAGADAAGDAQAAEAEAELNRLAKAFFDAATAYTKKCVLVTYVFEEEIYDRCPETGAELDAVAAAAAALEAHGKAHPGSVRGEASSFARQAALFGGWVVDAARLKKTRGTVWLYQKLAIAWNAWRPKEAAPVDPVTTYLQGGYLERPLKTAQNWRDNNVAAAIGDSAVIPWAQCFDGPCIPGY